MCAAKLKPKPKDESTRNASINKLIGSIAPPAARTWFLEVGEVGASFQFSDLTFQCQTLASHQSTHRAFECNPHLLGCI